MSEKGTTLQVRMWALKVMKGRRRKYGVRWVTASEEHSEWYEHRPQAENRRSDLLQAMRRGEEFDIESGLPVSELQATGGEQTLLAYAQEFVDRIWKKAPPQTRKTTVDNLASAVAGFVVPLDNAPDGQVLRRVLTTRLLPANTRELETSLELRAAASWIGRASRPITELSTRPEVRQLLESAPMTLLMSGKPAAPSTVEKRRLVLHRLVADAVEREVLTFNPMAGLTGRASMGDDVAVDEVDPRTVVNPRQARQLLAACTYVSDRQSRDQGQRLHAFFACLYFGGLRPGEALGLHSEDCVLPDEGWGELVLCRSFSASNARYSDEGRVHEERALKRRARREIRRVPIPPELVVILREHMEVYGTASDGRLFRGSKTGQGVPVSVYTRAWKKARVIGLAPHQVGTSLAARPYDLRHAAVSTWLNGGADPAEVAARAGHSVAVLLKIYAKCVDGNREVINRKIDRVLRDEH